MSLEEVLGGTTWFKKSPRTLVVPRDQTNNLDTTQANKASRMYWELYQQRKIGEANSTASRAKSKADQASLRIQLLEDNRLTLAHLPGTVGNPAKSIATDGRTADCENQRNRPSRWEGGRQNWQHGSAMWWLRQNPEPTSCALHVLR